MSIGGSIALLILGAILAFGITDNLPSVDLFAIGVIIMVGGAIGLVLGITLRMGRERRLSTTEVTQRQHTDSGDVIIRRTDREVLDDDDLS
jgi:Domain of unknown function (DUF6458)